MGDGEQRYIGTFNMIARCENTRCRSNAAMN